MFQDDEKRNETEKFVRSNKLKTSRSSTIIRGVVPGNELKSSHSDEFIVQSIVNDIHFVAIAVVMEKILYSVNRVALDFIKENWGYTTGRYTVNKKVNIVDIIIGVEYANVILLGEKRFIVGLC